MRESQSGEVWREVPGYEGRYEVSDLGNIRSWINRHGQRRTEPQILSHCPSPSGYHRAVLSLNGNVKTLRIHRLVALVFLGEPPSDDYQVNHINGIKTDNRVVNLEWATATQNIRHAINVLGKHLGPTSEQSHMAKLNPSQVIEIRSLLAEGLSLQDIAGRYGVHFATISAIKCGKTWRNLFEAQPA